MRASFAPSAQRELCEARDYYEMQQPGLGERFLDAIAREVRWICENPRVLAIMDSTIETRKCHVAKFPYFLIYTIENGSIVIHAVAHASRNPRYWEHRLK